MSESTQRFDGLVVVAPSGTEWRWRDFKLLPSAIVRKGKERVEKWAARCPRCGSEFIAAARMLGGHRYTYLQQKTIAHAMGSRLSVRCTFAPGAFPALEVTACRSCLKLEQRHAEAEAATQ